MANWGYFRSQNVKNYIRTPQKAKYTPIWGWKKTFLRINVFAHACNGYYTIWFHFETNLYDDHVFNTFSPQNKEWNTNKGGFLQKNILYFKELFILPFFTQACLYRKVVEKLPLPERWKEGWFFKKKRNCMLK